VRAGRFTVTLSPGGGVPWPLVRPRPWLPLGLAAVAFLAGLTGLREFDVFHHLALGRWLVSHGLFGTEPFLAPLEGQPLLPGPYWLGSITIYAAHLAGGVAGVVLLVGAA